MKRVIDVKATHPGGRPMGTSGGFDRIRKRLRRQIKKTLKSNLTL